ncbi:hypothetical protein ACFQ88_05335 [Paenibacillus sp. NPDC056579]|uniref:hypothetical protein n=1 Tax=unclassified Paenibacillus TaxID=185978 RepID=UPI001EF90633|nr:hypothetical protein [Paenibacillus sp. H1-7]ULL16411.1 hypothetical protein DVH26_19370 [Paenibacillus sp. H1-7]
MAPAEETVPSLEELRKIANRYDLKINEELNPHTGFELFSEELECGFAATIISDFYLFSIDVYKPYIKFVTEALAGVLRSYSLPTGQLNEDIQEFNNTRLEILTEYERYWVQYLTTEEKNDEILLLRYRRFVEE